MQNQYSYIFTTFIVMYLFIGLMKNWWLESSIQTSNTELFILKCDILFTLSSFENDTAHRWKPYTKSLLMTSRLIVDLVTDLVTRNVNTWLSSSSFNFINLVSSAMMCFLLPLKIGLLTCCSFFLDAELKKSY